MFGEGASVVSARELDETPPVATTGIWRVSSGSDSAILKLVTHGPPSDSRWPSSADPDHPYYWRREPLAYESGLLDRLAVGGLRAPMLRASFERGDALVALWLEDLSQAPRWSVDLLGSTARRLGRAQAAYAAELPAEPWLSRGWLRVYLDLHQAPDPEREAVLARLDALPQTICHHDFHPANVLGADGSVVIDWAYCGLGALGLDAGVLVADGIADGAFAPELADAAAASVWDGYSSGLAAGGWTGSLDDVRWAYLRGTALRLSWLAARLKGEANTGRRARWRATVGLLERWRREAERLA